MLIRSPNSQVGEIFVSCDMYDGYMPRFETPQGELAISNINVP